MQTFIKYNMVIRKSILILEAIYIDSENDEEWQTW